MEEKILYEEKQRTYLVFYGLLIVVILIEVLAIAIQLIIADGIIEAVPSLALSFIILAGLTFILVNFFFLRLRISDKEFKISYGIFKLRIPREAISNCQPTTFSWKTYFGWGIRPGFDKTFAWTSKGSKGIRVETKGRTFVISTGNAKKICEVLGEG
ncbi:MAG: hypothetical protein E3J54_01255 [Actinobacteria bacterium]|nr:MAG: hypothetical protein E3J54_01255 [Actinomycetota bacterium]